MFADALLNTRLAISLFFRFFSSCKTSSSSLWLNLGSTSLRVLTKSLYSLVKDKYSSPIVSLIFLRMLSTAPPGLNNSCAESVLFVRSDKFFLDACSCPTVLSSFFAKPFKMFSNVFIFCVSTPAIPAFGVILNCFVLLLNLIVIPALSAS